MKNNKFSNTKRIFHLLIFWSVCAFTAAGSLSAQQLSSSHPVSLYKQGVQARLQGDLYLALEMFRKASEKNPGYFDPIYSSAEIYFQLEEYDQALSVVEKALELSRGNSPARILKARILVGMGKIDEAAATYQGILKAEPNNVDARLGKAELDIAVGKHRNAALEYLETLKASPNNRRALLSLAVLSESQGNSAAAETYFETALRYHGESAITHLLAGDFYLRKGMLEKAEIQAELALSLRQDYEAAYMLLGTLHYRQGAFEKASAVMDKVLALNRKNTSAWYLKALVAFNTAASRAGIEALRTLLTIKPEDEIARISIEDALREYLPLEDPLRPSFADYHFDRGEKFQERNLFSRAYEEYRRGLQINPYSKRGRLDYADILAKIGFQARSLAALHFLKDQKLSDTKVDERIELTESLLDDRVSKDWNIDQFLLRRPRFSLALFVDRKKSFLLHHDSGLFLTKYVSDLLVGTSIFSLAVDPSEITDFGSAFQEARQRQSDYFVLLSFAESEREFSVSADIYLSRTGSKIHSIQVYRTGNDRVQNGLVQISANLSEIFPVRGELLKREFERGLVSIGKAENLKVDDTLLILTPKSVSLKHDAFQFVYGPEDVLGSIKITKIDDLVAEGIVEKKGFFDRINAGDTVLPGKLPDTPEKPLNQAVPDIPLYRRILRIEQALPAEA